jgi:NADPH:quinone reductase
MAEKMRAARIHAHGGPNAIVVEEIDVPSPEGDEVLVRVDAAGVNWADAERRGGGYSPVPMEFPWTLGLELVGVVDRVGPAVSRWREGDLVYALPNGGGAYAEYAIAAEHELIRVPEGIDPRQGLALTMQGLTAALMLKETGCGPGDTVLIEAAGSGLGLIAVQLAKIYGAETVVGIASTAEKRAIAVEHGADFAVDSTVAGWSDEVREKLGGEGVDLALEMTGGAVFDESLALLADFGRMIVFAGVSKEPSALDVHMNIIRNLTVRLFYVIPYLTRTEMIDQTLAELAALVGEGRLEVMIGGTYSLAETPEMHRLMEERVTAGKLLVTPAGR